MLAPSAPTTYSGESVSLSGSMDGTREPKSKLEYVAQKLGPYREQFVELQKSVRPWREFFVFRIPSESGESLVRKIQTNLAVYQSNYVVVSLGITLLLLLRSPSSLIAFSLLAVAWSLFWTKNDDVTWKPVLFGTELSKQQRLYVMYGISAVVFFLFALDILFSVLGVSALTIILHATLNNRPVVPADEHQAVLDQI